MKIPPVVHSVNPTRSLGVKLPIVEPKEELEEEVLEKEESEEESEVEEIEVETENEEEESER